MLSYSALVEALPEIEESLGCVFKDKFLLALAFVHRSYFNEKRGEVKEHNERLEFLGDSVLGVLVSEYLYVRFPEAPEGELSHMRSYLVDAKACSEQVQELGLDRFILLGKGEQRNTGRGRETILADLFEALIGALFLDGGTEAALKFFHAHIEEKLDRAIDRPMRNWKAELQDYVQKKWQTIPTYQVLDEEGPDHRKLFHVGVFLNDHCLGEGKGESKKEAEVLAAKEAMEKHGS